jgi:pimeloyl-ACP methyl ester carboxylesterase
VNLQSYRDVAVWSTPVDGTTIDVWCLHAFGDSHLAFREAFAQPLAHDCRVLLLDLPGHGASPPRPDGLTINTASTLLAELVSQYSERRQLVLVAHSMAALIATRLARELAQVRMVVSVEGNLTPADAYFSAQAAAYDDPQTFSAHLRQQIDRLAVEDDRVRRYVCSLAFADPFTLWTLGRSVAACAAPGLEYADLSCASMYYWDPEGAAASAQPFLASRGLRHRPLGGLGHWPMVSDPDAFYAALRQDVLALVPTEPTR